MALKFQPGRDAQSVLAGFILGGTGLRPARSGVAPERDCSKRYQRFWSVGRKAAEGRRSPRRWRAIRKRQENAKRLLVRPALWRFSSSCLSTDIEGKFGIGRDARCHLQDAGSTRYGLSLAAVSLTSS